MALENLLFDLPVKYQSVTGCYKKSIEESFIIDLSDGNVLAQDIADIAFNDYGQEAVLLLNDECIGTLLYADNRPSKIIGKFKALESYTRIEDIVYKCIPIESQLDSTHTSVRRLPC